MADSSTPRGRRAATCLAALGLVVALTSCTSSSPQPTTTVTAHVTATAIATVTAKPAPSPVPSTASGQACATSTLAAAVTGAPEGDAAGSHYYLVILTNIGSTSCRLNGYPRVESVGDSNGTQIGAEADHDHDNTVQPYELVLQPRESASAKLTITPAACDGSDASLDGFRVFPPDQKTALFAADAIGDGCSGSNVVMHVGGFQGGGEGDF